jgi:hypothetical protein
MGQDNVLLLLALVLLVLLLPAQSTSRMRRCKFTACPHFSAFLKESYTTATWRGSVLVVPASNVHEEVGLFNVVDGDSKVDNAAVVMVVGVPGTVGRRRLILLISFWIKKIRVDT